MRRRKVSCSGCGFELPRTFPTVGLSSYRLCLTCRDSLFYRLTSDMPGAVVEAWLDALKDEAEEEEE